MDSNCNHQECAKERLILKRTLLESERLNKPFWRAFVDFTNRLTHTTNEGKNILWAAATNRVLKRCPLDYLLTQEVAIRAIRDTLRVRCYANN